MDRRRSSRNSLISRKNYFFFWKRWAWIGVKSTAWENLISLAQPTWHLFIPCKTRHVCLDIEYFFDLLDSGGSHTGAQLSTGLCGLSKAIRDLGLSTEGALNIDFLVWDCFCQESPFKVIHADIGLGSVYWQSQREFFEVHVLGSARYAPSFVLWIMLEWDLSHTWVILVDAKSTTRCAWKRVLKTGMWGVRN